MDTKSSLSKKTARLDSFLNLDRITSGDKNSSSQIRLYYLLNRLTYRRFHSEQGFMHFRISKNGTFAEDDIYYQPDTISRYIRSGDRVMELGPGQGANLLYLAQRHPNAMLLGLDLLPAKLKNAPSNVCILKQDYSNLSRFQDSSFDVVYAIETIVHASDKTPVFREVYRVLKPGGVFLVFDYVLSAPYASYPPLIQTAIALISKGAASALIEPESAWEGYFRNAGFHPEEITDLTKETMPDLKRLAHKASRILDHPQLARAVFRLFPAHIVNNIVVGYLGYDSFREGVLGYRQWIFRKKAAQDP